MKMNPEKIEMLLVSRKSDPGLKELSIVDGLCSLLKEQMIQIHFWGVR